MAMASLKAGVVPFNSAGVYPQGGTVQCMQSTLGSIIFRRSQLQRKNETRRRLESNYRKSSSVVLVARTELEMEREVEVGGSGDGDRDVSEKKAVDVVHGEERDISGFGKKVLDVENFMAMLAAKQKIILSDLKERHAVYRRERTEWGIGVGTIFTVFEDADGKCLKVEVNENEILLRCGIEPRFPQFADDGSRALADSRLAQAKLVARGIESGRESPSPLSTLFKYEREGVLGTSTVDDFGALFKDMKFPTPYIAIGLFLALCITVGLKAFSSKNGKRDDSQDQEIRLMKMRKMRARMNREEKQDPGETIVTDFSVQDGVSKEGINGAVSAGPQMHVHDSAFSKKVLEIRAMARQARIQEKKSAETESLQKDERKRMMDEELAKRSRSYELETLAKSLDDVRTIGAETVRVPKVNGAANMYRNAIASVQENTKQEVTENGINGKESIDNKQVGEDSNLSPGDRDGPHSEQFIMRNNSKASAADNLKQNPKLPSGVKPRIILSAEEARACMAAKRAKLAEKSKSGVEESVQPTSTGVQQDTLNESATGVLGVEAVASTRGGLPGNSQDNCDSEFLEGSNFERIECQGAVDLARATETNPTSRDRYENALESSFSPELLGDVEMTSRQSKEEKDGAEIKSEEEEEMIWMSDDVLREIVFKVHSNEEAGREPFHNLNSQQESLFFKGLERKFEREGEQVKKWIKDRVENLDYGQNESRIFHPPENYSEPTTKEADEPRERSKLMDQFKEDCQRIMREETSIGFSKEVPASPLNDVTASPQQLPTLSDTLSMSDTPSHSSSIPSLFQLNLEQAQHSSSKESKNVSNPPSSFSSGTPSGSDTPSHSPSLPLPPQPIFEKPQYRSNEELDKPKNQLPTTFEKPQDRSTPEGEKFKAQPSRNPKSVISSSGGGSKAGKGKDPQVAKKSEWQHTKKWAKDLQRKYAMEQDTATKAMMLEIGKDLDRWMTEEEIEKSTRLLDSGPEGEQEYVRMHYEKTKAKIKQQAETFGPEAMVEKYRNYKPEKEENELWWLSLPFVLGIVLCSNVEGEDKTGLYSLDLSSETEGLADNFHTVAFQDMGDAQNFCHLLRQQYEKVKADVVEIIPFPPKELYQDAKDEGFRVTVVKKGQLRLSIDHDIDEVEQRILEIGSASYFDDKVREQFIDLNAVLDDGFGYS